MTRNDSAVATMGWGLPRKKSVRDRLTYVLMSSHGDLEDAHYNDVVDRLLAELSAPTREVLDAIDHQRPLRTSTMEQWRAAIRAIKDGK